MKYWTEYIGHQVDIKGKRKLIDNTIYSFDIETTSYLLLNNKQIPAYKYDKLSKDEQEQAIKMSCMYIWMFSINTEVYYGRSWKEFIHFLEYLSAVTENLKKIVFVHNLSFEFQFLKSYIKFDEVEARKTHKVMKCISEYYNIEFRCSLFLSNCRLELLPDLYKLPVDKLVGDLDYNKIRHSKTPLSEQELKYCENDCLVVYYYIKRELEKYKTVNNIPLTSTGHVRRELKEIVMLDWNYKRKVSKAINTNPHVYNLLVQAFAGGYTHANWIYADTIIDNVDSWDFTSSYPYVLVTHKYPSTEFKKCYIKKREEMSDRFAYILVVRFKGIKCKYYNNFISGSKCRNVKKARYDNGRIMQADELEITLTDIDFKFIMDSYKVDDYEIIECYYSSYNYLPYQFINFILDKYVDKTQFKNVEGMEVAYNIAKQLFNSLYRYERY